MLGKNIPAGKRLLIIRQGGSARLSPGSFVSESFRSVPGSEIASTSMSRPSTAALSIGRMSSFVILCKWLAE